MSGCGLLIFAEIKLITEAPIFAHYKPKEDFPIQCDASSKRIGIALLQQGKPVVYASRVLSDMEQRYGQIEIVMLAMVFSLEKFHQYMHGRKTQIHTDHKQLEAIVKILTKAPKILQKMLLRTQKYGVDIVYVKGRYMYILDML